MRDPYPRLARPLRGLEGDSLRLWGDRYERHRTLEALIAAWERGDATLQSETERVDRAVRDGLAVLELPRGPIRAVQVGSFNRGWLGRKTPRCEILLDGYKMRAAVSLMGQPDLIFRTWVHESIHGRQPFVPRGDPEGRQHRGFEEGMAEGLARLVCNEGAAIHALEQSYTYYVMAYRMLADAAGIEVEALWRRLWTYPLGDVREVLVDAVDALRSAATGRLMSDRQRARLSALADGMFQTERINARPDERILRAGWDVVFR